LDHTDSTRLQEAEARRHGWLWWSRRRRGQIRQNVPDLPRSDGRRHMHKISDIVDRLRRARDSDVEKPGTWHR
jgi:hypothetical protein